MQIVDKWLHIKNEILQCEIENNVLVGAKHGYVGGIVVFSDECLLALLHSDGCARVYIRRVKDLLTAMFNNITVFVAEVWCFLLK